MDNVQPTEIIKPDGQVFTIYKYTRLDSTNAFLKRHCLELQDYATVWAEEQTNGRGRFDRVWSSRPGEDVTFSFLLPLESQALELRQNITQIAALAVARLLEGYGLGPTIKWPNDVLVKGKKICGILCEIVEQGAKTYAVLGMGLNVNSSGGAFASLDRAATSMRNELDCEVNRHEVINRLLGLIIDCFDELNKNGFARGRQEIKNRLMFVNERVIVKEGKYNLHPGKIIDINKDGTLLFNCDECNIISLNSGEITFKINSKKEVYCDK